MFGFKDKYKHSIYPFLDYLFASEFYAEDDCRYNLSESYKDLIGKEVGVKPYNCKISVSESAMFDVYLYFQDIRKVFIHNTQENILDNTFNSLFMEALQSNPIPELKGKPLNPEGVFIKDFLECYRARVLTSAMKKLKVFLNEGGRGIIFSAHWNSIIYLFFRKDEDKENFLKRDIRLFKQNVYEEVKSYDIDHILKPDSLYFSLDVFSNFTNIGGHKYFTTDAMFLGKRI